MTKQHFNNRENFVEYNISPSWYKDRKPGISAMLRVGNEEEWIGPCLESIIPFFDEIIISLDCSDKTREIIQSFSSKKIKVYDYPFRLGAVDGISHPDSLHDQAYYYNWTLSKTTKTHVSKWDADMIMLPDLYPFKSLIQSKNVVRVFGYNVASLNPPQLIQTFPFETEEVRFFKVNKHMIYRQPSAQEIKFYWHNFIAPSRAEVFAYDRAGLPKIFTRPKDWLFSNPYLHYYRLSNILLKKEVTIKNPMYIHTKYIKTNKTVYTDTEKDPMPGEKKRINIPKFMFKSPKEYIGKVKV